MKQRTQQTRENEFWVFPHSTKAIEVGLYYGFTPTEPPQVEKSDHNQAKGLGDLECKTICLHTEEKIALLRTHFSKGMPANPIALAYEHKNIDKKHKLCEYCFDIIGTPKSIADATLIKVAYDIACEEGFEDVIVELNTIGDRESFNRFYKELTNYFKKHLNELHTDCRQLFKKNALAVLACSHEECRTVLEHAPRSMNFLSEQSRLHFMELLEMIEMANIPYTLNNALIDHPHIVSHTLFAVYGRQPGTPADKERTLVASGARWTSLAKKVGFKKDIPGASAHVFIERKAGADKQLKKMRKPQFYFIHMGNEAKLKSLTVIDRLRIAKIPVYHALTKDKLTAQLTSAENLKVPYILIMGQKESMENTVLVRNMTDRSQDTVRVEHIGDFLKKLI